MNTKLHNIFLIAIFLICPIMLSVWVGYSYYNEKNVIKTSYRDYGHEARLGRHININGENLKVVNHNFWASTYTMSNGVEIDDDYIDQRIKAGHTYTCFESRHPKIESICIGVLTFLGYFVIIGTILQETDKLK